MNCTAPEHQTTCGILRIACATALSGTITVALPQSAHPDNVTPPPVPSAIQVPAGSKAFLVGHAVGTQEYICLPCPNPGTSMCPNTSGFAWILFTPQATLFKDNNKQIITHFFSPNPFEDNTNAGVQADGMIRPTWQDSQDTSTVWAMPTAASSDLDFAAPGATPWLRLDVVGSEDAPTGGHKLAIDRLHPPAEHQWRSRAFDWLCTVSRRRQEASVPYSADYFFYK